MYVLGLNGPPRCGKDTIAQFIYQMNELDIAVRIASLSYPLRTIAYAIVGREYHPATYEEFKSELFERFNRIGRQIMVDVSESFLKQLYGQAVMGEMFVERHKSFEGLLLVPDCGFPRELTPIIEMAGQANTAIARVHRDGFDFTHDSRDWVYTTHDYDISNNGDLDELRVNAVKLVATLRTDLGWKL